jgi:RimJ/RimL family protein N-acetyltransferase
LPRHFDAQFNPGFGSWGIQGKMKNAPVPISTDRCLLRPATTSDFDALAAAIGSPAFPYELPLADWQRRGKLQDWFESMLVMSLDGKARVFSIDLAAGTRCVGQVSLVQRDVPASWNLAYWLHPSHWGAGLAVEAAQAVIRYGFTVMRVGEVWAGAALWNTRSIRTLDKLGLQPIENAPTSKLASSAPNDLHICSISRERWLQTCGKSDGGEA